MAPNQDLPAHEAESWRTLAWNGVRFAVPPDVEPAEMEKFYLRAADGNGLQLECKWQQGKSVSRSKALKRLGKALKGVEAQMGSAGLPPDIAAAFKKLESRGFTVQPFSWKRENLTAAGALLRCGVCGRSSLLQCVGIEKDQEAAAAMLAGFADHEDHGGVHYALFGIAATVPRGFTLKHFSFKPGQYRLELEGDRSRRRAGLVLERVGPANVLFGGVGFAQWAQERFAPLAGKGVLEHGSWQKGPAVLWQPQRHGLRAMASRLLASRRLAHVRAWQPQGSNAVLCVALSGGGKTASTVFEEVCSSYVLAQESQA